MTELRLTLLDGEVAVWRLGPDSPQPLLEANSFLSVTRTAEELSIVSSSAEVPADVRVENGWRCLKVEGPLAFEMTGVLAAISAPLANAEIPIFVVSTFDTDYLLVKAEDLEQACGILGGQGHTVDVRA